MLTGTVVTGMGLMGLTLLPHDCKGTTSFLTLPTGVRVASVLILEGLVSRLDIGSSKSALG